MRETSSFIGEIGSNKLFNLGEKTLKTVYYGTLFDSQSLSCSMREITWQSQGRFLLVWYGNRVTWQSIAWLLKSRKPSLDDPQQVIPVPGGVPIGG